MNFNSFKSLVFDLLTNLSDGVEVRRANQGGSRPNVTYLTWDYLSGIGNEAPEYARNNGLNVDQDKVILESFSNGSLGISISAYGPDALNVLRTIAKKIKANQGREALTQLGITYGLSLAVVNVTTIQNITELIQSKYEDRYLMDLSFNFGDSIIEEVDFIEKTAELEGPIGD